MKKVETYKVTENKLILLQHSGLYRYEYDLPIIWNATINRVAREYYEKNMNGEIMFFIKHHENEKDSRIEISDPIHGKKNFGSHLAEVGEEIERRVMSHRLNQVLPMVEDKPKKQRL